MEIWVKNFVQASFTKGKKIELGHAWNRYVERFKQNPQNVVATPDPCDTHTVETSGRFLVASVF